MQRHRVYVSGKASYFKKKCCLTKYAMTKIISCIKPIIKPMIFHSPLRKVIDH